MHLDYYLWINKIKFKDFAAKIGIGPNHLSNIVRKKMIPSLLTAIKIHKGSDHQVSFEEMASAAEEVHKVKIPKPSQKKHVDIDHKFALTVGIEDESGSVKEKVRGC